MLLSTLGRRVPFGPSTSLPLVQALALVLPIGMSSESRVCKLHTCISLLLLSARVIHLLLDLIGQIPFLDRHKPLNHLVVSLRTAHERDV